MAFANLTNLPTKGVDLSAVTQAGQSLKGGSTSSNPSTSLNVAGAQTPNALQSLAARGAIGQMSIPGPNLPGGGQGGQQGSSSGQGPGPGGIRMGSYDPKSLTQEQRQWLWQQAGKSGNAPIGYGGESNLPPSMPSSTSLMSFVPPPVPTPSATFQPKGVSGATSAPGALSTGGGVSGSAFPALTQTGTATKGLQLPGLAQSVMNAITGGAGQIGKDVSQGIGTFATGVSQGANALGKDVGSGVQNIQNYLKSFQEPTNPTLPQSGAQTPNAKPTPAPNQTDAQRIQQILAPGQAKYNEPVPTPAPEDPNLRQLRETQNLTPLQFQATQPKIINYNQAKAGTAGALTDTSGKQTTIASQPNLQGSATPVQATSLISSVSKGTAKVADVVPQISNQQAPAQISKAIATAAKSGDMEAVDRLQSLYQAVAQQNNFIQQIGQIVTALSAGFGSPQSQDITSARMPMIQQGIGQGLTGQTPNQQGQNLPNQQQNQIPYLPTNLQTANPVQQQRPPLSPVMGQ